MTSRRRALPIALLAIASCPACLYFPPVHHTAGLGAVETLEQQPEKTREDVEGGLGRKAEVLRKNGVYVYDWSQSYGYLFVGGYGGGGAFEFTGRRYRALVTFDGDRVVRFERFVRAKAGEPPEPPAGDEPTRVRTGCSSDARCLLVAVAEGERPIAVDTLGQLWTWDGDVARLLAPSPDDEPRPPSPPALAISPDGRYIAFGRRLDTIVFDLREERAIVHPVRPDGSQPFGLTPRPSAIAFTSDGSLIAIVGFEKCVQPVDTDPWSPGETVKLQGRPIDDAAFVPRTKRLLAVNSMGDLAYLDVKSGEPEPTLLLSKAWATRRLAIAPDGHRIALLTTATLEQWDLDQLERERDAAPKDAPPTFTDGHETAALIDVRLLPFATALPTCPPALAFAPDGSSLAVSIGDRIGLFPAGGGPATRWLSSAGQLLCGLAFTRDGSRLFSTTPGGLAEWTIRPELR